VHDGAAAPDVRADREAPSPAPAGTEGESAMPKPAVDGVVAALVAKVKESGEGAFNAVSEQLLENPMFLDAMRRTLEAREQMNRTVSGALDLVNVVSKNDVERIVAVIEDLGTKVARQQRTLASLEQNMVVVKALVEKIAGDLAREAPESDE
jgi:hypothetical protein